MVKYPRPSLLKSMKRKHPSSPDDMKRDPTYFPGQDSFLNGRTPPTNALWKSKAPLDARKRAITASAIPQDGVCALTHEVAQTASAVQFSHAVASATTGETNRIRAIECVLGLPAGAFNLHSSRNIQPLAATPHDLLDSHRIAFIPDNKDGVVDNLTTFFYHTPLDRRSENNVHQLFPRKLYPYRIICVPPFLPDTFILHLKDVEKDVSGSYRETGKETPYHSPFLHYPLFHSHVSPALMALNAGEKMKMLDMQAMDLLARTYGREVATTCSKLRLFYEHLEAVSNDLPADFLSGAWLSPKASVEPELEPPAKRLKTMHSYSEAGKADTDSIDEAMSESSGSPTTLVAKATYSNVAPSMACGPLFDDDDAPHTSNKPIGSRHKPLEGLTWENFTGQPFDYVDPYKAMEIYKRLEEQRCKPLFQVPPTTSRIPRLSPQAQASPASDFDTPSRASKSIPRNANGQKIYSLRYTKRLARSSRPADSSPTPSPPKKAMAPSFTGSQGRSTGPIPPSPAKDERADVPAPTVAAPSVVGSSRGRGNTAVAPQSRIPVPSSRLPVPSTKLSQRRFAQAKDAPPKYGQR